jgi:hypothetical protein
VKTKEQFIAEYKTQFPTIKVGSEQLGYTFLEGQEYETTIDGWADDALLKQEAEASVARAATDKAALLNKLGITAEEAQLLLGGN